MTDWQSPFFLMIKEIKKVGKDLGITPTIIRDEELKERGFGGISCWKFIFLSLQLIGMFCHLHCNILFARFLNSFIVHSIPRCFTENSHRLLPTVFLAHKWFNSLFSRYLWSWQGSSASSSPSSSQSHSRWCYTDHCMGGQRYCVWHWRTQH